MPLRANWYNLNAGRRYPLDDKATGTDDTGVRLADDIIADCHLRFPVTAGRHAFIGGITITDTLITVVFLGSTTVNSTRGVFTPLGAVTIVRPADENVHYPIQPLYPGVGGFIAFGNLSEVFAARFSTPLQGLLAPRCARSYDPLPVAEMRKLGVGTGLTGLITIVGEDDIEVVKDTVAITDPAAPQAAPMLVDALVIRLRQEIGGVNVLEKYIGPCGKRPESGNCDRVGIELINGTRPDCDGNINIDFRNMIVGSLSDCAGFTLDASIGINEACRGFTPERFRGKDLCFFSSVSAPSLSSSSSSSSLSSVVPVDPPPPSAALLCFSDTLCTSFENPADDQYLFWDPTAAGNSLENATYFPATILADDFDGDPSTSCWSSSSSGQDTYSLRIGGAARDLWLLRPCDNIIPESWDLRIITDMRINSGAVGLVLGWHLFGTGLTQSAAYYMVLANMATRTLEIFWFPGAGPPVLVGSRSFAPHRVRPEYWYRWKVYITKVQDTPFPQVIINASLESVNDPNFPLVSYSVATRRWAKYSLHGFAALAGSARVSWLNIK